MDSLGGLHPSWNAFSDNAAKEYLNPVWHPNRQSLIKLIEIIRSINCNTSILELGCGNASNLPILRAGLAPLQIKYHGVDFSRPLLNAAQANIDHVTDKLTMLDITKLTKPLFIEMSKKYDICLLSHVVEIVESPSWLLNLARESAKTVIIRWYRPPTLQATRVELLQMHKDQTGNEEPVHYVRWSINQNDYINWAVGAKYSKILAHSTEISDRIDVLY